MSNDAARAAGSYAPACSASVPEWVAEEIKATWQAARDAGGEMQAFRIIERMVDRLGYGRMKNNPSLVPNHSVLLPPAPGGKEQRVVQILN